MLGAAGGTGEAHAVGAACGDPARSGEPPVDFPVASRQFSATVNGLPTEFLFSSYSDRLMLIITQLSTLGSILRAEQERALGGEGVTFRIDTLLGVRDDPALELCARQLAQLVADAGCQKPLVCCLGLARPPGGRGVELQAVRDVVAAAREHPLW